MSKKGSILPKSKNNNNSFPIVAVGASAGGMEAMIELLKDIPVNTGMAFVYIQHLDEEYKSRLDEILSRATTIPVQVVTKNLKIQPDNIYLIPHDQDIEITGDIFNLKERKEKLSKHLPIDRFFMSLAESSKEPAIGILLSGSSSDGTNGLRAIKLAGGITFAQDDTAKFKSMPRAAVAEGIVDRVLAPAAIAEELVRLSSNIELLQKTLPEPNENEKEVPDAELLTVLQLLRKTTGVDFRHYKVNTIRRRLVRRILLQKCDQIADYISVMRKQQAEILALYHDILINVTSFFRDAETLEYVKKSILPKIISSKQPGQAIRIWVPACSTGEEAYTLAMILLELLSDRASSFSISIFATDLSEPAIAKARLGLYSKNDVAALSPARIQRFFTKVDGSYRIVKSIRDLCVFAPHNVFKDPPFSRLDLISCCNLMIYLDVFLQKKLIGIFHYALQKNGYLIVGKSETIGSSGLLFSQPEKKFKVFQRKNEASVKTKLEMMNRLSEEAAGSSSPSLKTVARTLSFEKELEQSVNELLLSRYVPASVVINTDLEILHFRGSTGLFMEPSPGKASLNLLKMVRVGLAFELRSAIHKCIKSGKPESKSGLEVKYDGSTFLAAIEVSPLPSEGEESLYLVVFEKLATTTGSETSVTVAKDKMVKQLQLELDTIRDDMRSILEEQEASLEELQSANEEIVSSNEELQSINEELETSKEEVESTNEELLTINKELQVRNEQLAESYDYAEAVFNTIREAVLVLDSDFRIRTANDAFYRIFNVREESTEGRLIYEIGNRQWDIHKLRQLLEEIIPSNSSFNNFEVQHEFTGVGEKIMVLNARRIMQRVHGKHLILLAIEDITEHRQAQRIIAERETWFRNMANNAPVMIWVAGLDKKRNFFNKTWIDFTGQDIENDSIETWRKAVHPEDIASLMSVYDACFIERKTFMAEYRLRRNDGDYRWVLDVAKPTFSTQGGFLGYVGSCTELHDKKVLHDELRKRVSERTSELEEMNKELQRSNRELQQFAYVASHDLQEPLRKIMTFADRMDPLKADMPEQAKLYIDKISESSRRMTRLIDDLLDYSRISRSGGKFVKTDLNHILKEVLLNFELVIKEKNAVIKTQTLPVIHAVPLQMEQLFQNLISNAFKFAKEDRIPEILIHSSIVSSQRLEDLGLNDHSMQYHEFIVKDNGIGFPPEFSEQIFVIFQRLNDKKLYPGTGIGLALCERIVTNHEGIIYAESRESEGAEFHVILPVKPTRKSEE